jgi:superfamily II DNA or RNA helicase
MMTNPKILTCDARGNPWVDKKMQNGNGLRMISLNRSGSYFFINGEISPELVESIDSVTSYYVQNYEKTEKFQKGLWDGKERLLRRAKNGSYYFPFGLIDSVKSALSIWGVGYQVRDENTDQRVEEIPGEDTGLRPYQVKALNQLRVNCYNSSGVLALPTGAGKTRVSLVWAEHLLHSHLIKSVLVLVHRVELMRQWRTEIAQQTGRFEHDIGMMGAGEDNTARSPYTVTMIQTMSSLLKQHAPQSWDTGLLIVDECHTISAKTFYDVSMHVNAKYRLGLSATPTRSDGAELKIFAACGTIAAVVSVEDLVRDGYLAAPVFRLEQLPPVKIPYSASWATVYKSGIVLNMDRNVKIAEIAEEYLSKGRQCYVHVNQIDHGKCLTGMINGAVFVCGSTKSKDREDIIERFKSGEIRCLVSTLLREGVSIDGISCLIYASSGKSEVSLIQTIGRALRVDPEFGDAVIVDFLDRGHRILENHVQDRISAYRENYGNLFQY